jgi:hypothetical protein
MDRIQIFTKPFGPDSIAPSPLGKVHFNKNEGLGQKQQEKREGDKSRTLNMTRKVFLRFVENVS